MPTNALLVRWFGGWRESIHLASISTYGRREALLGLGALQSLAEVDRVALEQLGIYADLREEIAADLAPVDDDDTPYVAFRVGDRIHVPNMAGTVNSERVIAITVSEDDNGELSYAPELRDVILEEQERQQQALDKMLQGTMGGTSKVATPVSAIGLQAAAPNCCPPAAAASWTLESDVGLDQNGGHWTSLVGDVEGDQLGTFTATVTCADPDWPVLVGAIAHNGETAVLLPNWLTFSGEGSQTQTSTIGWTATGWPIGFGLAGSSGDAASVHCTLQVTGTHDDAMVFW